MALPKIPVKIIIICVVFAIIGGVWGAHVAGLINLNPVLANLPVIGNYVETEEVKEGETISPLEEENKQLVEKVSQLEAEMSKLKTQLNENLLEFQEKEQDLNEQVESLQKQLQLLEEKEANSAKLAEYYSEMKPKNIVPIFDNLDDEVVVNILLKLESDQTSDILAELDPLRAAKLTKNLTDINNKTFND